MLKTSNRRRTSVAGDPWFASYCAVWRHGLERTALATNQRADRVCGRCYHPVSLGVERRLVAEQPPSV